jgi:hypothetical protein
VVARFSAFRQFLVQQYEEAFRDNAIDVAVLPELTPDDLKDLGVSLVGHRRKLLAAIAALRSEGEPELRVERREVTSAEYSGSERTAVSPTFQQLGTKQDAANG